MLATIEAGGISPTSGRAVFVADANAFSSIALSGNILAYLVPVPEPNYVWPLVIFSIAAAPYLAVHRHRRAGRSGTGRLRAAA
jgi:hypothetical protein